MKLPPLADRITTAKFQAEANAVTDDGRTVQQRVEDVVAALDSAGWMLDRAELKRQGVSETVIDLAEVATIKQQFPELAQFGSNLVGLADALRHLPASENLLEGVPENPTADQANAIIADLRGLSGMVDKAALDALVEAAVPRDFGESHGTPISNLKTILPETYRALGHDEPPAIMAILVEPLSMVKVTDDSGSGTNPFGHAAIAFTVNEDGQTRQVVMNIVGKAGREMVNFMPAEDYLYGVDNFQTGSEQGGAYNRPMYLGALWQHPQELVDALRATYEDIKDRSHEGKATFSLALPRVRNLLAKLIPGADQEAGNCARWTSLGLVAAGLRKKPTMWPKEILVDLLQDHGNSDNFSLIKVDRVRHANRTFGTDADINSLVSPYRPISNLRYRNLDRFVAARIAVDEDTTKAQARLSQRI